VACFNLSYSNFYDLKIINIVVIIIVDAAAAIRYDVGDLGSSMENLFPVCNRMAFDPRPE